jgi:Ca2+-binding EF-hand superfamily protein
MTTSAIGGSSGATTAWRMQRPDPAQMVDSLFSKIDTKNQGYIDKQELSATLNANNSASATGQANSSRADQLFSKLDSSGDGQVSKQELADGLNKTGAIHGYHRGPEGSQGPAQAGAAPPPPGAAGGADNDSSSSSTDSSASKVFAAADTNQDGSVSFQELVAYQATQQDASAPTGAANQSDNSNAAVMKMMMQLMQAYGFEQNSTSSSTSSAISATA